ncbi:MAG: hypothetical protein AAGF95_23580 [Chloroflexota bacterium]
MEYRHQCPAQPSHAAWRRHAPAKDHYEQTLAFSAEEQRCRGSHEAIERFDQVDVVVHLGRSGGLQLPSCAMTERSSDVALKPAAQAAV